MEKPNNFQSWDDVNNSNYVTTVVWGRDPDCQVTSTYGFTTQAELEAFTMGASEMDGWLTWEIQ